MSVVSGMRPTGKLHLGHFLGVLKQWIQLQENENCYFFVADWHALSTSYEDKLNIRETSRNLVKDWLSVGINPSKSILFIQSSIKEHSELYLLLNMITPLGWLERNPTYKDQISQMVGKNINTAGFLTYPVLQASDIILYDATKVPIGEDQKPHLEITREIVRRFHYLFGNNQNDIFIEPQDILNQTPKLLGLDGRKMSKSYGNSIYLSDSSDDVWAKLKKAKTDTNRIKLTDKGNPNICLVFDYHQEFSDKNLISEIRNDCENGKIGCFACKKKCFNSIEIFLNQVREKREKISDSYIDEVLEEGNKKAKKQAENKMKIINELIFNKGFSKNDV